MFLDRTSVRSFGTPCWTSWPCRPKCLIYHYLFLYIFFSYVILYRNTLLLIIIIVIIKMSSSQGPHLFFTAAQKSLLTACVNVICIFIFSSHLCLKNLIFFINLSSLSIWLFDSIIITPIQLVSWHTRSYSLTQFFLGFSLLNSIYGYLCLNPVMHFNENTNMYLYVLLVTSQ